MNFRRALMCRPTFFNVTYKINEFMSDIPVNTSLSMKQWEDLKKKVENCGVKVEELSQVKGLPDMVFCCNAGLVVGNKVYLSHFRHPERQGERQHYLKWFTSAGFEVFGDQTDHFEGGGDSVFSSPDVLWAGYGFRSDKNVYEKIQQLGSFRTILCELSNSKFYHLDTCFAPLDSRTALWYPAAFSNETQSKMSKEIDLIAISEAEANSFVCNCIAVGQTVISPPGMASKTKLALEQKGFSTVEVDMSEFMKAGGATQCLIMRL